MNNLIKEWDLKIFSFPPSGISFMGDGESITAVYDYAVGGTTIPVLRDVIEGTKCIAELDGIKMHYTPVNWDCFITGGRKVDTHYALENGVVPSKKWKVGNATFIAPLYDWTREEVQAALEAMGLPHAEVDDDEDTGNIAVCTKCLKAMEPVECPQDGFMIPPMGQNLFGNLTSFRKRFLTIQ